jgi:FADH2 O2-dependent halogenase
MDRFDAFAALSKLYFAAAMFAETTRRLGQPDRVNSFLLMNDPKFGPSLRHCMEKALHRSTPAERQRMIETILKAVEPFDLAGLGDSSRRNWYPCLAEDLLIAAPKLGVERAAIEQLLTRCGFAQS